MSKVPINRSQGRSVVVSTRGIVATEHPLASQAGAMVLAQGGHAVDAAVAANAVMGVVCPDDVRRRRRSVCDRERARREVARRERQRMGARAADARFSRERGRRTACRRAASIPSPCLVRSPDGRFFSSDSAACRSRACSSRRSRSPTKDFRSPRLPARSGTTRRAFLRGDPEAAKTFLPDGRPLAVRCGLPQRRSRVDVSPDCGERRRRVLSRRDRAPARRRARAARLDDGRRRSGGVPRAVGRPDFDDLPWLGDLRASAERRRHRGADDVEHHGGACRFGASAQSASLHILIEAKKLAYADMLRHVADPAFSAVPVTAMLSKEYARERAA